MVTFLGGITFATVDSFDHSAPARRCMASQEYRDVSRLEHDIYRLGRANSENAQMMLDVDPSSGAFIALRYDIALNSQTVEDKLQKRWQLMTTQGYKEEIASISAEDAAFSKRKSVEWSAAIIGLLLFGYGVLTETTQRPVNRDQTAPIA